MASFASSATTSGARKHALTNKQTRISKLKFHWKIAQKFEPVDIKFIPLDVRAVGLSKSQAPEGRHRTRIDRSCQNSNASTHTVLIYKCCLINSNSSANQISVHWKYLTKYFHSALFSNNLSTDSTRIAQRNRIHNLVHLELDHADYLDRRPEVFTP